MTNYAKRRDSNESQIVERLRQIGASVYQLHTPLDLLIGYRGQTYLIEVKTTKGKLNEKQKAFIADWRGQYAVVRTWQEAFDVIGVDYE